MANYSTVTKDGTAAQPSTHTYAYITIRYLRNYTQQII
jgi:hypothetical protein